LKCDAILSEFDHEVETKCKQMRSQAEHLSLSIHNALQVEMMKLPKRIRAMKMKDLLQQHHNDLPPPLSTSKKDNQPFKIPLVPIRTRAKATKEHNITLEMNDGTELDITKVNADDMDLKAKKEAMEKLAMLQQQVSNLMDSLR